MRSADVSDAVRIVTARQNEDLVTRWMSGNLVRCKSCRLHRSRWRLGTGHFIMRTENIAAVCPRRRGSSLVTSALQWPSAQLSSLAAQGAALEPGCGSLSAHGFWLLGAVHPPLTLNFRPCIRSCGCGRRAQHRPRDTHMHGNDGRLKAYWGPGCHYGGNHRFFVVLKPYY